MRLPAKLALALAAAAAVAVFAANRFLNTEPRLTIKVAGAKYSEVVLRPAVGPDQRYPVDKDTVAVPVAYGKQLLQLSGPKVPPLWLFYSHTDVGLRRIVEIRIDSIDAATGEATLRYNGFKNNSLRFRFQDHEIEEQPLNLHGP